MALMIGVIMLRRKQRNNLKTARSQVEVVHEQKIKHKKQQIVVKSQHKECLIRMLDRLNCPET
ncbi:hypothetical protein K210_02840 [Erysipelothrix rhusiopathiae SY1027]|nr:hypothetical protein K210_02840 [Erysipelothrix rhusiopathiae SY1027]